MLKIKLARFGKKHQPHYRIVINEARDKRDGKYVESIGHYAPNQAPKILQVDVESYDAWMKKGAQPTDTVRVLVERYKTGTPFPAKKARISKKAKAKATAEKEAAAKPKEEVLETATTEAVVEETPEVTEATPATE